MMPGVTVASCHGHGNGNKTKDQLLLILEYSRNIVFEPYRPKFAPLRPHTVPVWSRNGHGMVTEGSRDGHGESTKMKDLLYKVREMQNLNFN